MLLIYSPRDSCRLQYTLQLLFNHLLGVKYKFTSDQQSFISYKGPKINYGAAVAEEYIHLEAADLLFSNEIVPVSFASGSYRKIKTIFHHAQKASLPFDPFAAAFYLVSRYEEYLPFTADEHERFPAEQSIAFKEGFHNIPVVNHYAIFLKELILSNYPLLIFPDKKFQFQLTYDIDMAFAFRAKGWLRNTGGFLRSLKNLSFPEMMLRINVHLGNKQDPFDTFNYQQQLHEQYSLQPIYFFLLGDHNRYDKNNYWRHPLFASLVKQIAARNETGIHVSYASNQHPEKIRMEKERLEKLSNQRVFRNRQHYLKIRFPDSYRALLAAGITEDYTMGYSSQIGFRASIAAPFYFYDLQKETSTPLLIMPFTVMDASLHYYLKLDANAALLATKQLADEVKKVNGLFIFLAHNDLISATGVWKKWRQHFEALISYCSALADNQR